MAEALQTPVVADSKETESCKDRLNWIIEGAHKFEQEQTVSS
jgi:hypothetical protein